MGEKAIHFALAEGGVGGAIGVGAGALLSWPHETKTPLIGTLMKTTYHNAFTDGEFTEVVIAGIVGTGVLGLIGAGLGGLLFGRKPE